MLCGVVRVSTFFQIGKQEYQLELFLSASILPIFPLLSDLSCTSFSGDHVPNVLTLALTKAADARWGDKTCQMFSSVCWCKLLRRLLSYYTYQCFSKMFSYLAKFIIIFFRFIFYLSVDQKTCSYNYECHEWPCHKRARCLTTEVNPNLRLWQWQIAARSRGTSRQNRTRCRRCAPVYVISVGPPAWS